MKLCCIIGKTDDLKVRTLQVLGSKLTTDAPITAMEPLNLADSANVPKSPRDVTPQEMTSVLSKQDIQKLWTNNNTVWSEDEKLFLHWHICLCHLPIWHIQRLAQREVLPPCLEKVKKMPLCPTCAFADAAKRCWRSKGAPHSIRVKTNTHPGAATSCDHLISHQPGLIPQVTGRLTNKKFAGAIMFSDHFPGFTYTHLVQGTTMQETLQDKRAYEQVARSYGVTIEVYRADNLRFNDKEFKAACDSAHRKYSYCSVGTHCQNGISEAKNKIVSYGARKLLLHALRLWPQAINVNLWPFALLVNTKRHNELILDKEGWTPLEKWSGIKMEIVKDDHHTWGCPVFVLASENQSGLTRTPKWEPHGRVGIYLGHSPPHAGNIALVLNLLTGLISPQYYVVLDNKFTTVPYLQSGKKPPNWISLVQSSSEHVTDEPFNLARTWYKGGDQDVAQLEKTREKEEIEQTREPKKNEKTRETSSKPPTNDSGAPKPSMLLEFVDIENLGKRRSKRVPKPLSKLKEVDPKNKELENIEVVWLNDVWYDAVY